MQKKNMAANVCFRTLSVSFHNVYIMIGTQEIIIIALIILLLFGGKKIPELMKGLGKGVKSFKDEMNSTLDSDVTSDENTETKK